MLPSCRAAQVMGFKPTPTRLTSQSASPDLQTYGLVDEQNTTCDAELTVTKNNLLAVSCHFLYISRYKTGVNSPVWLQLKNDLEHTGDMLHGLFTSAQLICSVVCLHDLTQVHV